MGSDHEMKKDSQHLHPEIWPAMESVFAPDAALEARISGLLLQMTLEQKVGQIIQADIAFVTPEEARVYSLGSILAGGNSAPNGELRASPQDWLDLADAYWDAAMGDGGSGIPILFGIDAVHGHSNLPGATIFPHNIGLGAANDEDLVERIGAATALEIAITGLDWTFAPTVAVARDLRWGRAYEAYAQSPEIVANLGAALITGLQGTPEKDGFLEKDKVVATAKHFIGDGGTLKGLDQGETAGDEDDAS